MQRMKGDMFGMEDYYDFFIKNNPSIHISKLQFNRIITEFNKKLADYIIENLELVLPYRLGKIEILKSQRKPFLDKNGKIKNNIPIDWKSTKELWEKDPILKEKKILIRYSNIHTDGFVFKIYYNKEKAIYKYKSVYFFKPVRGLSRKISHRINDYSKPKYDTYIKKRYV